MTARGARRWRGSGLLAGIALCALIADAARGTPPAGAGGVHPPAVEAPPASLRLDFPWRAWRLFSSNDLLPQNTAYAIAQDPRGFVYAGLGTGLARYDGAVWTRIALPGVARPKAIGALALDDAGSVWAGSDGAGVFRIRDGRVTAVGGLAGPAGEVYSLLPDRAGAVWASTDGGLARCTAHGCQLLPALRGTAIRTVLRGDGPNGPCLWIGTGGKGLLRFDVRADGTVVDSGFRITQRDGLPNNYISNLVQWGGAGGRDLWIGTGRGLARYDGSRLVRYTPAIGFPGSVTALLPGRGADRGTLFVGLRPGGLGLLHDDGQWALLGQAQGLPDSAVQGLAYTQRGSSIPLLWVGTYSGGIARADPGRWQLLDERRDVPARGMAGLGAVQFPDGLRTLWMGSAQGTLRLTPTGWQPVPDIPPGTVVADLAATRDGSLWVAGQHSLWRLHGGARDEFTVDNSYLPAVYADLLAVEPVPGGDALWIGTGHGLARWTMADGVQAIHDLPDPAHGTAIRGLAFAALGDAPSAIWVGTDAGLWRRAATGWEAMGAHCLRGAAITTVVAHRAPEGAEVWVGTDGPLVRIRAQGCERRDDLFPGGYAEQVAFDPQGRAYVFGTGGAIRLDASRDLPFAALPATRYGRGDGLLARDVLSGRGVAVDPRGRIWVASTAALQVFDPASEASAATGAQLVWDTLRAGTRAQPIEPRDELPAGTSPLVFAARLLAFEREEHIQYREQLVGLQSAPQPWGTDNRFAFSRLAPGDYQLLVWARDASGVVSGPLRMPFRMLAPWWQRPWALALDALALVALGLLMGWWRTRALQARARALAHDVAARTHELADANRLLEEMARTDALTGLHNRRHATGALPDLVRRHAERRHAGSQTQLLLVLVDVDHFKRINDVHGHAVGDGVLQAVASRLRHGIRETDMLVRWGGEEFLIALADCDPALAAARLRKVLGAVSDAPVVIGAASLQISVSAGAAAYVPPDATDAQAPALAMEQAIARADAALYEAKHRGRDRAVLVVDAAEGVVGTAHWPDVERAEPRPGAPVS